MTCRHRLLLIVIMLGLSTPAMAQGPTTGTPPFGSFGGGPDVINLSNLNTQWVFPIIQKAGRGTDFTYDLSFDSSVWYPVGSSGSQSWQPVVNWGWRGQTEVAVGYVSFTQTTTPWCLFAGQYYGQQTTYSNWVYHDSFGVAHGFAGSTYYQNGAPAHCNPSTSSMTVGTGDGSGWVLSATGSGPNYVASSSGAIFHPPVNNSNGAGSATDRNGNIISVNSSGQFTDTLGATALTVTGGAPNPLTFTYPISTGASIHATVNYTTFTVNTYFHISGISEYGRTSVALVTSIVLPNSTQYSFTYEATPSAASCVPLSGTTSCVTGRIASVTLPTGGQYQYAYSGGSNGILSDGTTATLSRTTPDGTWIYAHSEAGGAWTTIVTDPLLNDSKIQFQGPYETERQIYAGSSSSGTLLETVDTCYNGSSSPCTGTAITGSITQRAVSTKLDFSGLTSYGKSFYTGLGLPTEIDEYGFGTATSGPPLLRKTLTSYASLGSIAAFPQSVKLTDSGGNVISQSNFMYDESTPTTVTAPQHGSVSGSRGNLTTTQACTVLPSCSSYLSTHTTYDTTGQPLTATNSAGNVVTFSYTDKFYTDNGANPPASYSPSAQTNAYVTGVTVPIIGKATTIGYYFQSGKMASSVDQNTADSYAHFDAVDRLASSYLPPSSGTNRGWTLAQYQNATTVDTYTSITSTSASTGCSSCRHQQAMLDSSGRSGTNVLVSDPDGATNIVTTYDGLGRLKSTTNPYRSTSDPTYGTETVTYDALKRVSTVTHADGSATQQYYGDSVASAGGAATQLCSTATYGVGYPSLIVAPDGKKRETWIDGIQRVIEVDEADSTGALTVATCNSYDLMGNLTQITQDAQTRSYTFDPLSRVASETAPETGTVSIYYTTSTGIVCSGNPALICRKTDARGITTTNSYDALNRTTQTTYSDGTPTVQYFYDQTAYNGLTITNGKGRLTGMSDGSGSTSWSYNLLGQIITERHTIAGVSKNLSYTYNLDGSLASVTYPSNRTLTYSYSNAQRAQSVLDSSSGNYYAKNTVFSAAGQYTSVLYGATGAFAGITQTYSFNNRLQLTNLQASSSAGVVLNLTFSFPGQPNNGGQVSSIVNNVDNSRTMNVTYDSLNRIATAKSQATSGANCWGQTFGYDRWANLLSITVNQCSSFPLSLTISNNKITNTGYGYDAAGNLTGDGSYTYTYDAANRLTSAGGVSYIYDGRNMRVKKSNGTLYWRDYFGDTLAESDPSGNVVNEYVFFGGARIARVDSSGNVLYYFQDRIGTTRAITTSAGVVCYNADFLPFGTEQALVNSCAQNYKFTGYERDSETGLDYAFFRYYNSRLGRFMSADPLEGSVGEPQSLNRYAYVLNNPCNLADPLGLDPCSNKDVINFINKNYGPAAALASSLGIQPEFILGLAYDESHDPNGGFLPQMTNLNNYFGVQPNQNATNPHLVPFSNGVGSVQQPNGTNRTFYSFPGPGIQASLNWFQKVYGNAVQGQNSPASFATQLAKAFNPTEPKFASSTMDGINTIKSRLGCPNLIKNFHWDSGHPRARSSGGGGAVTAPNIGIDPPDPFNWLPSTSSQPPPPPQDPCPNFDCAPGSPGNPFDVPSPNPGPFPTPPGPVPAGGGGDTGLDDSAGLVAPAQDAPFDGMPVTLLYLCLVFPLGFHLRRRRRQTLDS